MSKIKNRNVLITGGASGIGYLMGEKFLQEGAKRLVIWDINEELLYKSAAKLQEKGYTVFPMKVDVSDYEAIGEAADEVLSEIGPVDIIVNNAGIVSGMPFAEQTPEQIELAIAVNVTGVMQVTRAFLPSMQRRQRGHLVNIASAVGLAPNPGMTVYAGSKWAVVGWSESLRIELEREYQHLHVTTVTPGYINTGMFEGVKSPFLMPMLEPDEIVAKIVQAVKDNEILLRAPWIVNFAPLLRGVMPTRLYDWLVGDLLGVYESMNSFHGKKGAPKPEKESEVKA